MHFANHSLAATIAYGMALPSPAEVRNQLAKILASPGFLRSEQIRNLLVYTVEATLEGRVDTLSEHAIGQDLFGQDETFDPSTNTIVRAAMRRLRSALLDYYAHDGKDALVEIDFPAGYKPTFRRRRATGSAGADFATKLLRSLEPTLSYVKYAAFYPMDLTNFTDDAVVRFRLSRNPEVARLSAPDKDTIAGIIREIGGTDSQCAERYWGLIQHKDLSFAEANELPQPTDPNRLRVLRNLLAGPELENTKKQNIENYLLTHTDHDAKENYLREHPDAAKRYNPFHWNGHNLGLVSYQELRFDEQPVHSFTLRQGDYFTFRSVADCSDVIQTQYGLKEMLERDPKLTPSSRLLHYLQNECQELIHGGFGAAVVVLTNDNHLVIRRRSNNVAKYKDANLLFMSVNEGLNAKLDIDWQHPGYLRPCTHIVQRGLREELVGDHFDLEKKMSACWITGVLLYLPNLVVNPCFLVSLDASKEEVEAAAEDIWTKDSKWEGPIERFLPFTQDDIAAYITETVGTRAADKWDEGSLIAVALSTALLNEIG